MIRDPKILQDVQAEWHTAISTWKMVQSNIVFSFAMGGFTSNQFRSVAYSMTLLFAFSAFEHVLQQLRDEGVFKCKSSFLGPLMLASQQVLPWTNYSLVDEARVRRNKVAHEQQWVPIPDVKRYIEGMETELRSWKIVV